MKIVAIFSYRYDKVLVPDLLKNIEPLVDEVISYDDTKNTGTWFDERKVKMHLKRQAEVAGADWILEIDPDERFEKNALLKLRQLAEQNLGKKVIFEVKFRELYTPDRYRIDGIWGRKVRRSLYPVMPGQIYKDKDVNFSGFPINKDYKVIKTGLNLYHLKMIEPANRIARRDALQAADPTNKTQRIGYDYLTDETSIKLEKIPAGREYTPEYNPWEFKT